MGWSQRPNGSHNVIEIDFAETKDLNDPAQVAALRTEMANERKKSACSADLTVRGKILNVQGVITDDDLFIYTIYTMLVTDVLRGGPQIQIQTGDTIEFTAPGGTASVDDKKVTFDISLAPLVVNDQYVVHLKRDNEADDYFVSSYLDIYLLDGADKVTRMDAHMWPFCANHARVTRATSDFAALKNEIQTTICK